MRFPAFNFLLGQMQDVDLDNLTDDQALEILPQDEATQGDYRQGRANGTPILQVLSHAQSRHNERAGIKTK